LIAPEERGLWDAEPHCCLQQEEMRRLDVRIGVAQHLLLFDWGRRAARDKEHGDAGGGLSLLLQSDPEGDGDGLEEDEDEYGDE